MLKHHFVDSLVQLAIVLSLLRTDLQNYLSSNFNDYPEVQDIMMGQTSAYTQTQFHQNQWLNNMGNFQGPSLSKHIDLYHSTPLLQHLQSVHSFYNIPQNNDITTFHLTAESDSDEEQSPAGNVDSVGSSSTADPGPTSYSVSNSTSLNIMDLLDNADSGVDSASDTSSNNGLEAENDLSEEDADLIEILWRQDMDMGLGREVYDLALRQEMQKAEEKKKELSWEKNEPSISGEPNEITTIPTEYQTQVVENSTVDGETGETIYLPNPSFNKMNNVPPPVQDSPVVPAAQTQPPQFNVVTPVNSFVEPTLEQPNIEAPALGDDLQAYLNDMDPNIDIPLPEVTKQENMEKTWDDVFPMLEDSTAQTATQTDTTLTQAINSSDIDATQTLLDELESLTTTDITSTTNLMNTMNITAPTSATPVSSVLLNNATLPVVETEQGYNQLLGLLPPNNTDEMNSTISHLMSSLPDNTTNMDLTMSDQTAVLFSNLTLDLGLLSANGTANSNGTSSVSDATELLNSLLVSDGNPQQDSFSVPTTLPLPTNDTISTVSSGYQDANILDDTSSEYASSTYSGHSLHNDYGDGQSDGYYNCSEGATGGEGGASTSYSQSQQYSPSYRGYSSPASSSCSSNTSTIQGNFSHHQATNSSGHYASYGDSMTVQHNHTYPQLPGLPIRETRYPKYNSTEPDVKALPPVSRPTRTMTRDEKRAKALKVPLTLEEIIDSSVEHFTEMVQKAKLTAEQEQLVRDIRRRGKNKVAAQNCRKRKMDQVTTLEDEVNFLVHKKQQLREEQVQLVRDLDMMKNKMQNLEASLLSGMTDSLGRVFDPRRFRVEVTSSGELRAAPHSAELRDHGDVRRKVKRGKRSSRK